MKLNSRLSTFFISFYSLLFVIQFLSKSEFETCRGTIIASINMTTRTSRLGNKMFQYASSYGIARQKRMKLVLPPGEVTRPFLHEVFPQISATLTDIEPNYVWNDRRHLSHNPEWKHVQCNDNVQIRGLLQSWKYFDMFRWEVQQEFRFRPDIEEDAQRILKQAINKVLYAYLISLFIHTLKV